MGLWMKPESAFPRVVEDDRAGLMQRVRAQTAVPHPPLALLRRLLVEPVIRRAKPIPAKLRALAAVKYREQMELRKRKKALTIRSKT